MQVYGGGCSILSYAVSIPGRAYSAKEEPEDWSRADLPAIRAFLVAEAARGAWSPLPDLPL